MEEFISDVNKQYIEGYEGYKKCHCRNDKFHEKAFGAVVAMAYFPPLGFLIIPYLFIDAIFKDATDIVFSVPYKIFHEQKYDNACDIRYLIDRYHKGKKDEWHLLQRKVDLREVMGMLDKKYTYEKNKVVFEENAVKGNFYRPNGTLKSYKSWAPLFGSL